MAKPGIVYGNLLPATGAYLLACSLRPEAIRFGGLIGGLALVIGGSCALNNVFDRRIDRLMERTKRRAIATGRVPVWAGITYGLVLIGVGLASLWGLTSAVATLAALAGCVGYVGIYAIAKRRTAYGTLIGSIAGAMPPVVGYTAHTGAADPTALVLCAAMVAWQMPHFYAIAVFRLADYQAAGLPVWPSVYGLASTWRQIWLYIGLFWLSAVSLYPLGRAGLIYGIGVSLLSAWWGYEGWQAGRTQSSAAGARRLFKASLLVLLLWSAMLAASGTGY